MRKHYISEIDIRVNKSPVMSFDYAMKRIEDYIIKHIDPDFNTAEFKIWYSDGADKAFICNSIRYYWESK